ncbi:hypothetical protein ACRVX5_03035 [Clostridioides difficile]|nr:hypothetical protein BGU59_09975 [Clostridioides difficile]VHU61382.1 Uncharacterised protein [Clostridioides difficile]HBG0292081.1 hypothetical protein [Clostridioides difficile]HBG2115419.1 hypothetical protein [Clostridioides difficile]HBG2166075.1 hypothetical protein [Clostridioides difficile]
MDKEIEKICIEAGKRICKMCKFNNTCEVENKNGCICECFEVRNKIERMLEKCNFITAIDFQLKNISMKEVITYCEENNKKIEISGWGKEQIIIFTDKERVKTND